MSSPSEVDLLFASSMISYLKKKEKRLSTPNEKVRLSSCKLYRLVISFVMMKKNSPLTFEWVYPLVLWWVMIGQNKASGLIKLNILAEEGTTSYLLLSRSKSTCCYNRLLYCKEMVRLRQRPVWQASYSNMGLLSNQHKKSVTCNVRITETEQLVWPAKDSMLQLQRDLKNGLCGLTIIVSRIMTMQTAYWISW